jgi:hypothetical protein
MFSAEELQSLDRKYFNVIAVNDYDVTVMSRNTGHYWYMHNPEYPESGTIILFHRHTGDQPYHYQKREKSLRSAVRYIRKHDRFQLNGRKW